MICARATRLARACAPGPRIRWIAAPSVAAVRDGSAAVAVARPRRDRCRRLPAGGGIEPTCRTKAFYRNWRT